MTAHKRRVRRSAAFMILALVSTALLGARPATAVETTATIPTSGDAQVNSGSPTVNYGTSTKMAVCAACPETGAPAKQAIVRFDVELNPGAVTEATLRVYAANAPVPALDVYQVAAGWSESTITWDNAPALGALVGSTPGGGSTGYYDIPLDTDIFSAAGEYAFAVTMQTAGVVVRLGTEEAAAGTRPLLLVTSDDGVLPPPPPPPPPPSESSPLRAVPDATVSPSHGVGELGRVSAIAEANGRIYIAGNFRVVGGATRNYVAAVNSATGALDPNWNPNANGPVYALRVGTDGTVYVGGTFSNIGGAARARLARLDSVNGSALPWNPGANAEVRTLAVANGRVFVGGTFSTVGGSARSGLAAVDAASGALITTWRADTDTSVRDIEPSPDGNLIYLGGNFVSVGGTTRRYLAAVDTSTGAVSPWTPSVPFRLFDVSISTDGTRVYTAGGGAFRNGGNQAAAYDTARSGAPLWDTQADGDNQAIEVRGSVVYVGGHFNMVANQRRNHVVALDVATGAVTSWNPGADSVWGVFALRRGANSIMVGGDFSVIGGRAQPHFARFSPVA